MASSRKRYSNIDEILDFVTEDTDSDSEEEKLIESDSDEEDCEWEFEEQDAVVNVGRPESFLSTDYPQTYVESLIHEPDPSEVENSISENEVDHLQTL